jgi:methylglutaconyl-CoA hydratase
MGTVFCSGFDLQEAAIPEKIDSLAALIAKTLTAIYKSSLATIAVLNGPAIAGGAGVMSACDFVIASSDVTIRYPEVHRGLVAAQVMTLLVRQVGWRIARELLLLGEPISAERAVEIGLINYLTKKENLLTKAFKLAEQITAISQEPFLETKRLLSELEAHPFEQDMEKALFIHIKTRKSFLFKQN